MMSGLATNNTATACKNKMTEKNDILFKSTLVNAQVCTITAISIRPVVQVKCLVFELELR